MLLLMNEINNKEFFLKTQNVKHTIRIVMLRNQNAMLMLR